MRSIEDEDEYDNVDEVIHLTNKFIHLYGICCRVLWGVVGRERLQDRLEREEEAEIAAQFAVEFTADETVDQGAKGPEEEADKFPDEELLSNPDDQAVSDSDGGEDDEDDEETEQAITDFYNRLEDCKCLGAVLALEFGPSKFEKQQKIKKKFQKLQAWRRRIQGIATEEDMLKPSPLSLPPVTLEPDLNEQIG